MRYFTVISGKKLAVCGAAVVAACVVGFAVWRSGTAVSAAAATRDLPIYSVEREEKVCALTFDAAWGNDIMRKNHKESYTILIIARKAAVVPESYYKT